MLKVLLMSDSVMAYVESGATALEATKADLNAYKNNIENELRYNSQVCYLRGYLNDSYDSTQRRILIENVEAVPFLIFYRRAEEMPVMMDKRSENNPVLVNRRDVIIYNNAFNVIVPADLQDKEEMIIESVNKYRLVTKMFNIKYL